MDLPGAQPRHEVEQPMRNGEHETSISRPAIRALLVLVAGILIGWLGLPWPVGVGLLLLGAGLMAFRPSWDVGVLLLLAAAGWFRWAAVSYSPVRELPDRTTADVEGVVIGREDRGDRVELRVRGWVRAIDRDEMRHGTLSIYAPAGIDVSVRYGTKLRVRGLLIQPSPPRNPGGFDMRRYLDTRGVAAILRASSPDDFEVIGVGGWAWRRALDRFRVRLFRLFDSILEPPYSALLAGVLLGEVRGIPPSILRDFRQGGVIHVLVVSGANFAVLAWVVFVFLRVVRVPLRLVYVFTLALSALFAILVGLQPQVVRAGLLIGLYLVARLLERDADPYNLVALSALLILMWNPFALFDVGFQLSFGATVGLVALLPRWQAFRRRVAAPTREPSSGRFSRLRSRLASFTWDWVALPLLTTLAAQIVVTPIIAYHFQRFYWAGFLANIPVALLIAGITVAALVTAAVGLIWAPIGALLGNTVWLGFRLLLPLVHFFATLPYADLRFPRLWVPIMTLYLAAFLALTHLRALRQRPAYWALIGMGTVAAHVAMLALWPTRGLLQVTFLDVGQGDAAFVRLPDDRTLLIDGGSAWHVPDVDPQSIPNQGERTVVPYLLARGVRHLDWVIMSHSDIDHAGGLPTIVEEMDVGELVGLPLEPFARSRRLDVALRRAAASTHTPFEFGAGAVLDEGNVRGKPLRVQVLFPAKRSDVDLSDRDTNADSLVVMIRYGEARILFTGDMPTSVEAEIAEEDRRGTIDLRADILKVGHHGSATSSSEAFLRAVGPRLAVISVGAGNTYGHPSREVIERLDRLGIPYLRTDEMGAVETWTDGTRFWVETALGSRRVTEGLWNAQRRGKNTSSRASVSSAGTP